MSVHSVEETRNVELYPREATTAHVDTEKKPVPLTDGTLRGQDGTSLESTAKTAYVVQAGDTPLVIAKKLGLTGQEAKDFAQKVQSGALKEGKYHKFGFRAGDTISLPGNHANKIADMKKDGNYHTDLKSINEDFVEKTEARTGRKVHNELPKETPSADNTKPVKETETPKPVLKPKAVTNIPGYNEPENTTPVALIDLKKDDKGRYIIPKGNYSIDSASLPADSVKFVLADKNSNLVFNGKVEKKDETDYKPVTADFIIRNGDPANEVYKSGDFEYRREGYFYKGKPINPDEWDIQTSDIKSKIRGKSAGLKIHAVKKDTIKSGNEVKWTERKIEIDGPGKFYASEIDCPISAHCGGFEIGTLGHGACASLEGSGNIQEVDAGNNFGVTLANNKNVNIRSLKSGIVMGGNVDVADMTGGQYNAGGTVFNLDGGVVEAPKSNIVIMNKGHVLAANCIKVMQGGFLDLYKVKFSGQRKTVIENYLAGKIDSCDGSLVVIKEGFNKSYLAQADSPMKEKRGGIISDKTPPSPSYSIPQSSQQAGLGNPIEVFWGWLKKQF